MSSEAIRRVSRQDIQLVQNLIERCLQLYMSQKEVVDTLLAQAKIEPGFTELVWQKLEEENREFFKAYYLRLMVKHQIIVFNKLLKQQVQLMHQIQSAGVRNGSHSQPLHPNSSIYAPEHTGPALKPENLQNPLCSTLPHTFSNGSPLLQTNMRTSMDIPAHSSRIDVPPTITHNHIGILQGINGGMIKSEVGYSGNIPYMFDVGGNVLETRPSIGDASVASFSSVESSSQPMNDQLLDAETSSFGGLGQIPRNFSLSDLTADFSQSSDILESYARSPFLLNHSEREQGDNRRLDSISEGLSYEDFRSEKR